MKLKRDWPPRLPEPSPNSNPAEEGKCFFLSATWLNAYLACWSEQGYFATLVSADIKESICGVLSVGIIKSRLGMSYVSLGFNEATDPTLNHISIEVNGLICSRRSDIERDADGQPIASSGQRFEEIFTTMAADKNWDELRLSSLEAADFAVVNREFPRFHLTSWFVQEKKSYAVSLSLIREKFQGDYLSSRSANNRSQLRRARKQVELKFGPCHIEQAQTLRVANEWFDAMGKLHIKQWENRGVRSGFLERKFTDFQKDLISATFQRGSLQLLKFSAGERTLGYIFNFKVDGHVYFNMSGIDYEGTAEFKPGLLAHWFAIEYNLKNGEHTYDFLVGTNRYKESLCTHQTVLGSIVLRRKRWFFTLEHKLRQIRALFKPN